MLVRNPVFGFVVGSTFNVKLLISIVDFSRIDSNFSFASIISFVQCQGIVLIHLNFQLDVLEIWRTLKLSRFIVPNLRWAIDFESEIERNLFLRIWNGNFCCQNKCENLNWISKQQNSQFLLINATNLAAVVKIRLSSYGSGTWHSKVSWFPSSVARSKSWGFNTTDREVFQPDLSLFSLHFSFKGSTSMDPSLVNSSSKSVWWEVNLIVSWLGKL